MTKQTNPAEVVGSRNHHGNHQVGGTSRNDNAMSCHGKSFSKKSFDELAAEKGIKTFK